MISTAVLESVNSEFNELPYRADPGPDDWTPIGAAGDDCDSYAMAKYRKLLELGWPKEMLRLATCWDESGQYHAVLLADLDGQTWVLDNRYAFPVEYQFLKYRWHKIQVAGSNVWEMA